MFLVDVALAPADGLVGIPAVAEALVERKAALGGLNTGRGFDGRQDEAGARARLGDGVFSVARSEGERLGLDEVGAVAALRAGSATP